jgi:glutathione S-transferase
MGAERQEGNAMTENHDRPVPRRDDLQLLLEDLACVCGTLSEIMTAWRRAQPGRPELRPGQLVRLQDDARQLAADLETAAKESQPWCAADRLAALAAAAAAVRAVTCAPGGAEAGDRGLWELIAAAVRRAQARRPALTPVPVTVPG